MGKDESGNPGETITGERTRKAKTASIVNQGIKEHPRTGNRGGFPAAFRPPQCHGGRRLKGENPGMQYFFRNLFSVSNEQRA